MDLYILRHGIAVERGTASYSNDSQRPLTAEGKKKLRKIRKTLCELGLSLDAILSSPYVRARDTAELLAAALAPRKKVQLSEALSPDGSFRDLVAELKVLQPDAVLLVGHEPYLSTFISLLVTGAAQSCVALKKGGLCKLAAERLRAGRCAKLEWLLTPRQMLRMK